MRNIIYSKFSNDRCKSFKIRTDILEDDEGVRYVRKVALTKEGRKHLEHMHRMAGELRQVFDGTIFEVNKSSYDSGQLELEYVRGKTLEEMLDECLMVGDKNGFCGEIRSFTDELRRISAERFVPCESYYEVFGADALASDNKLSMKCSDIDIIFPNIVVVDKSWIVLDYEWTFSMTVPVDFILFRSMHYYATPDRRAMLGDINMCELLGIDESECGIYMRMEENFQKFVYEKNVPLWQLYGTIGKKYFFPAAVAGEIKKYDAEVAQFVGSEYISATPKCIVDDDGRSSLDIEVDSACSTLVIKPVHDGCVMYIDKVQGYTDGKEIQVAYGTNGESSDNRLVYCANEPQILIDNSGLGLDRLHVEYSVSPVCRGVVESLIEKNRSFNDLRCKNLELATDIQTISGRLNECEIRKRKLEQETESLRCEAGLLERESASLRKTLEEIENSTSWKVTAPLRSVGTHVRRQK